jgi:hypothetical protein
MIREELRQLPTGARELRRFGVSVGGVCLALGAWLLHRHRPAAPWLLAIGGLLLLLGLAAPRVLKPVYLAWMALAFTLGLILTTVLLTVLFFAMITPISLVARVLGKDFLSLRLDAEAPTYWIRRQQGAPRRPEDYEQQY